MSEYRIETRRRSRSKTPFLRSQQPESGAGDGSSDEATTAHSQKSKKISTAPKVTTIAEAEPKTPARTHMESESREHIQKKVKTSDYSSEEHSPTTKEKQETQTKLTTSTTTTTVITKQRTISNSASGGGIGSGATSTPISSSTMQQSFTSEFLSGLGSGGIRPRQNVTAAKEVSQNWLNAETERTQQHHYRQRTGGNQSSDSFSRLSRNSFDGSNVSVAGSERSSINNSGGTLAYQVYKESGQYWNVTPKTDYTYSRLSKDRRILAPGVVAMPNMSRRSLENHHANVNKMVQRNPTNEEYIRRRYEQQQYATKYNTDHLHYDSTDELDRSVNDYNSHLYLNNSYNNNKSYGRYQQQNASWWSRIIMTIVTTVTSTWTTVKSIGSGGNKTKRNNYNYYDRTQTVSDAYLYGRNVNERGFFGKIAHWITTLGRTDKQYTTRSTTSSNMYLSQRLYAGHSGILVKESKWKRCWLWLLLLLLLLPLLLWAGFNIYRNSNETFPSNYLTDKLSSLPQFSDIGLPNIDLTDYVNAENYDAIKADLHERWLNLRDLSDDYLTYLKTVSQNIIDEGRKLFQNEEHFERV